MTTKRKNEIQALLKGIETGNPDSVAVVNEDKYIQHNPQTHEGSLGLADLFRELAKLEGDAPQPDSSFWSRIKEALGA